MKKNTVIDVKKGWWAWVGGNSAVAFDSEQLVAEYMLERAQGMSDDGYWRDIACPVRYILWDCDLDAGETYHKVIFDPITMIVHNGHTRKILERIVPSKLKRMDSTWVGEYLAAEQDETVMVTKNKKGMSLIDQLALRWP